MHRDFQILGWTWRTFPVVAVGMYKIQKWASTNIIYHHKYTTTVSFHNLMQFDHERNRALWDIRVQVKWIYIFHTVPESHDPLIHTSSCFGDYRATWINEWLSKHSDCINIKVWCQAMMLQWYKYKGVVSGDVTVMECMSIVRKNPIYIYTYIYIYIYNSLSFLVIAMCAVLHRTMWCCSTYGYGALK